MGRNFFDNANFSGTLKSTDKSTDKKNTTVTSKTPNTQEYVVGMDIPLTNIKTGTIFTYDKVTKTAKFPDGTTILNLDINARGYFRKVKDCAYAVGDIVLYESTMCTVKHVDRIRGTYCLKDYYSNIEHPVVYESSLTRACLYWFINSSGQICTTYVGKNMAADKWRVSTGNVYASYDDARAYFASVNVKPLESVDEFFNKMNKFATVD